MIISKIESPGEWTSREAKILRDFLDSDVGKLALEWAAFKSPDLLDGAHQIKTLVRSGEVKGYQDALMNLVSLTTQEPEGIKRPSAYPSLDDDAAWSDLESITKPKK